MATALRELAVELGLEVDGDEVKDVEKALEEVEEAALAFAGAFVAAMGTAAIAVTELGREMAVSIDSGARQLGVSRQEFQQWTAVAQAAGQEGEKIIDVMANLQEKARDAALDPRGQMAQTFEDLGIAVRDANGQIKNGPTLVREVSDALARMGPGTEQTATAMQLFGDAGRELLPVLGQGSAAINRVIADFDELGGGLSEEAIESSLEFNRALLQLKATVTGALSPALRFLNPLLTGVAELMADVTAAVRTFVENSTAIRTALAFIGAGLLALAGYLTYTNAAAIALWVTGFAPLALGVTATAGAIAALTLILDDLAVFLEGGDSAFGAFLDTIGGAGTAARLLDEIRTRVDRVERVIDKLKTGALLLKGGFDAALIAGSTFASTARERLGPLGILFDGIVAAIDRMTGGLRTAVELAARVPGLPLMLADEALTQAASGPPSVPVGGAVGVGNAGYQQQVASGDEAASRVIRQTQRIYAPPQPAAGARAGSVTRTVNATVAVQAGVVDQNVFARQLARDIGPVLAQAMRDAADDSVTGPDL